ncbi:MAG: glycosyltransferase family 4 protein [Chitinispirillaceae bacterium]|nr:glycosyltransferase family 4 protein [Chitinispirillaceae bacterium]
MPISERMDTVRSGKPLRIAFIGHKRIPGRESGIEVALEQITRLLVKKGHKVDAYNRAKKGYEKIKDFDGVKIITIPTISNKSLDAPVYSFFAAIRSLFGGYDVVHYHAEGPCMMLWLNKLFGQRVVVTIHGLDWQRAKWNRLASEMILFGERCAVKYADEVIVLSRNVQQYFKDTYNRETRYIPNGVVEPTLRDDAYIRSTWDLQKDEYILFLGRIVPEKGVHYLIDAYKTISTNKKLVIAGGSSHTDEYYESLKRRAAGDNRIVFTGFIEGIGLESLYSNAYFYVLPSDVEGMPISLLEAMSYGNCCLTSNIPECTEVLNGNSISFAKSNIEDLKNKMSELLFHNEATIKEFRRKSLERAKEYDWNNVAKKTEELYWCKI